MRAVLISIKPQWCELIASGEKTVEVRKTRPKIETPFKVYIYCTQGKLADLGVIGQTIYEKRMKVIGEFVCDEITEYEGEFYDDETYENIKKIIHTADWEGYPEIDYNFIAENGEENSLCKSSCLTWAELRNYMGEGINTFYAWHISDLVVYGEPRELNSFCRNGECSRCGWLEDGRCLKRDEQNCYNKHRVKRSPQSWCYVEEVKR